MDLCLRGAERIHRSVQYVSVRMKVLLSENLSLVILLSQSVLIALQIPSCTFCHFTTSLNMQM